MELETLIQEERAKPLQYVPVPACRLEDDRIFRLITAYGWSYYGIYTALELLLASRDYHRYPADQLDRLAWRLFNLDQAELEAALEAFEECGLISKQSKELGNIGLPYLDEIVEGVAKRQAGKRKGGKASAAKRQQQNNIAAS